MRVAISEQHIPERYGVAGGGTRRFVACSNA